MGPIKAGNQHRNKVPVYAWSLGCPKNRADTEHLLGQLGLPVELVATPAKARIIFLNTCAFIEPAVRESLQAIFEITRKVRRLRRKPFFIVAGCLPGRYGITELHKEIPEVDLWLDTHNQAEWPKIITDRINMGRARAYGRLFSTSSYLWLKIAEGCRHKCAFCTIPGIRGGLQSISYETLRSEVISAVEHGISEIDLVAQDTSAWGCDFQGHNPVATLPELVRNLALIPGLKWLRLFYLYPTSITQALLEAIASGAPVLPYLDIPFQHSEAGILKNMGRPFSRDPREILDLVRAVIPEAAIRTTLMVGYPGETDEDFQKLYDFVRTSRFYHAGVFVFQAEEGTQAAKLAAPVPQKVAEERRDALMGLQADISRQILAQYVGEKLDVLVDGSCDEIWPGLHQGRVWFQGPEVDGVTYVSGPGVKPGAMIQAEIADAQTYDLSALTQG